MARYKDTFYLIDRGAHAIPFQPQNYYGSEHENKGTDDI